MNGFWRALRAWPTLLRVGLAEMVAYRAEIVIWFMTASLPLIMMLVWDRVAEAGPVAGLGQDDFARYFAATVVVRQFTGAWVVWELNFLVRTGALSPQLLKPVGPLYYSAAATLAAMPFRLLVLGPLLALVVWWRPGLLGAGEHGWVLLPLTLLALAVGWLLNFMVQVVFGCLAFWLDQSVGIWNVWFGGFVLLSGYLFPLAVLPGPAQEILHWLPFYAGLGLPAEIAAGMLSPEQAASYLLGQVLWLVAFGALASVAWRLGVRRYEAFGA